MDRDCPAAFPEEFADELRARAVIAFAEKIDEHGQGKNWLEDEPRWHIVKAVDELMSARNPAQLGDLSTVYEHFAHAFNHMLFAGEITASRPIDPRVVSENVDSTIYRVVCQDCGWKSEKTSYSGDPYTHYETAKRAAHGHLGQGCDSEKVSIEEVGDIGD